MARTFENPANRHRETIDTYEAVAALFLGIFYLLYKGLWGHVFIWFSLVILPILLGGGPIVVLTFPLVSICYVICIDGILARRYLNRGWREVFPDAAQVTGATGVGPAADVSKIAKPAEAGNKLCPFCAEEIKEAAVKCKHCGSDLPAQPVQTGDDRIVYHDGMYMVGEYHFDRLEQAQSFLASNV